MSVNPFRLLCCVGLHSWCEVKHYEHWEKKGKYVLTSHERECSICDLKQTLV